MITTILTIFLSLSAHASVDNYFNNSSQPISCHSFSNSIIDFDEVYDEDMEKIILSSENLVIVCNKDSYNVEIIDTNTIGADILNFDLNIKVDQLFGLTRNQIIKKLGNLTNEGLSVGKYVDIKFGFLENIVDNIIVVFKSTDTNRPSQSHQPQKNLEIAFEKMQKLYNQSHQEVIELTNKCHLRFSLLRSFSRKDVVEINFNSSEGAHIEFYFPKKGDTYITLDRLAAYPNDLVAYSTDVKGKQVPYNHIDQYGGIRLRYFEDDGAIQFIEILKDIDKACSELNAL